MNSHVKIAFATLDRLSHFGSAIGICFINGHPRYSSFSYPEEFLNEYTNEEMSNRDATIHFGFQQNGTVRWSELREQGWIADSFILAEKYGIQDGLCLSVEVEGRKSIASVSRRSAFPLNKEEIAQCMDALTLATLSAAQELAGTTYSEKTLEFLELSARGATDKEVADALTLSIHGARNRRRNALQEVGAKTVAEALVIAMRNGALNLYQ